jgi:DNA-binding response OmpR family regulator
MKRILIVEDDRLMADVYRDRLRTEGFAVHVAADGKAGLEMFDSHKADLILLDLMLPQMSGVEVLKAVRSQFGPHDVPVIVITSAYIGGMVQQAWEAGANQVVTKATMTPKLIIQLIQNAMDGSPGIVRSGGVDGWEEAENAAVDTNLRAKFLNGAPATLAALWLSLRALVTQPKNLGHLRELATRVRSLTAAVNGMNLERIAPLCAALEALLRELLAKPRLVSASVLLTIAHALDTLKFLFTHSDSFAWQHAVRGRIMVVDDDQFTRQAVSSALKKVNLKVTCVDNTARALQEARRSRFDAILLDIEIPDTNGFKLCSQLRSLPQYQRTPIIFLTAHGDFEQRTESVLHGGDDFITKPFLFTELALKVLSFVARSPLKPGVAADSAACRASGPAIFSRRDLNALKQALLGSLDHEWVRSALHRN